MHFSIPTNPVAACPSPERKKRKDKYFWNIFSSLLLLRWVMVLEPGFGIMFGVEIVL
jgi:hypothetical protein